jgi:hypothetical protein
MNESEFEKQLRGLRPARPSGKLEAKIACEIVPAPRSGVVPAGKKSLLERLLPGLGWASVGAAAAVIAMLSFNLAQGGPKPWAHGSGALPVIPEPAPFSGAPERSDPALVVEANDEGIMDEGENGISRRVRVSSVERRSWTEANGAVTFVEVPREDVVALPVSFQ